MFYNRVVSLWNELPDSVVNAPSVMCFESRLDKFWNKYSIRFDFDKYVKSEAQKQAGMGTVKMVVNINEQDSKIEL